MIDFKKLLKNFFRPQKRMLANRTIIKVFIMIYNTIFSLCGRLNRSNIEIIWDDYFSLIMQESSSY